MTKSICNQRGVVTLATAVILMLAVFGITYFMSEAVLTETRIVSEHQKGLEAFYAAQSGIEQGKSLTQENGTLTALYPSDSVTFTVSMSEVSDGLIELVSTGFSKDMTVSRSIRFYKARKPGESDPPQVPIVARGGVNTSGNISAVNNYSNLTIWNGLSTGIQGSASTYTSIDGQKNQLSTIKNTSGAATYGADVVTGDENLANKSADEIVDAFFNYPTVLALAEAMGANTSDSGRINLLDVASEATTYCYTADCDGSVYAESFGGVGDFNLSSLANKLADDRDLTPSDYSSWEKASGRTLETLDDGFTGSHFGLSPENYAEDGTPIDFSLDSKFIGTPDNPVTIVATGEVTIPSNTYIFGVIVADKIRMQSNSSVFGGVVALSSDSDAFQGAGGAVVFMDEIIMRTAGESTNFGPVKSGWRDW